MFSCDAGHFYLLIDFFFFLRGKYEKNNNVYIPLFWTATQAVELFSIDSNSAIVTN